MPDSTISATLVCSMCPRFKTIATGYTAQTLSQQRLVEIADRIGWLPTFEDGKVVSMFCPQCVMDQSKKGK